MAKKTSNRGDIADRHAVVIIEDTSSSELVAVEAGITPQPESELRFDYSQIEERHRARVKMAARKIKSFELQEAEVYILMGEQLIEMQDLLEGTGTFEAWIEAEFNYGIRMAQQFMNMWRRFKERPQVVALLGSSAARLLSSPNVDDGFVAEVIDLTEAGERPTVRELESMIKRNRPPRERRVPPPPPAIMGFEVNDEELAQAKRQISTFISASEPTEREVDVAVEATALPADLAFERPLKSSMLAAITSWREQLAAWEGQFPETHPQVDAVRLALRDLAQRIDRVVRQ